MPVDISLANATVRGPTITKEGIFTFDDADFTDLLHIPMAPSETLAPDLLLDFGSTERAVEQYNILISMEATTISAGNWDFYLRPTYLRRDAAGDAVEYTVMGLTTTDLRSRVFRSNMPDSIFTTNHVLVQGGEDIQEITASGGITITSSQTWPIAQALVCPYVHLVFDNNASTATFEVTALRIWGKYRRTS